MMAPRSKFRDSNLLIKPRKKAKKAKETRMETYML
jgi:hypothetical protein